MKITKLSNILTLSTLLVLVSCSIGNTSSNEKEVSGNWETIVVPTGAIKTTSGENVSPFNTAMSLKYFVQDGANFDKENLENLYINEVYRLHKIFDRHYSYYDDNNELITNVKTINDSYGTGMAIKCSDELYNLIKLGFNYYEITNGYFNIFTGTITDYWDNIFEEVYNYTMISDIDPYYNEESKSQLESLISVIPKTNDDVKKQLTFDDEAKTITFNKIVDSNVKVAISVGGIAKGFASDLIKEKLVKANYNSGYLYSGGSSIITIGKPIFTKEAKGQSIGVINPEKYIQGQSEVAFKMKYTDNFAFSTSGNYTDFKKYRFKDNDGNYIYRHHIINPYTGYPMSYHRSVTLSSSSFSAGEVDALSTAFMNMNDEDCFKFLANLLNNKKSNLDLLLLNQEGIGDDCILTVKASSKINNTLTVSEGIKLIINE